MSEVLPEQAIRELGFDEEPMGSGDVAAEGRLCDVAATDGAGAVHMKEEQTVGSSLEESVLLESQLPSLGIEIVEVTTLDPKENMQTDAGDVTLQAPVEWSGTSQPNNDGDDNEAGEQLTSNALKKQSETAGWCEGGIRPEVDMKAESNGRHRGRRRGPDNDDSWADWPTLGHGWQRKEVYRRSGFSIGKTDTYYKSPSGHRLRSKIEMAKHVAGTIDLATFDYKTGMFLDGHAVKKMKRHKEEVFVTMEESSTPEMRCSPVKEGSPDSPRTPASVPSDRPCTPASVPSDRPCTPASVPSDRPCTPASVPSDRPCTPASVPGDRPCTPASVPNERPCTPASVPNDGPCTPASVPNDGPCTPASVPNDGPCTPPSVPSERSCTPASVPSERPCTPAPVHSHAQNEVPSPMKQALTPPRVIVVPQKAISPRIIMTPQRYSISPVSSNSLTLSANTSPFGTSPEAQRLNNGPPVTVGEHPSLRLSVPVTPSREPMFPQLTPPWLDPSLAPLSPISSPERDCDSALQDQDSIDSQLSGTHNPLLKPLSQSLRPTRVHTGVSAPLGYTPSLLRTCMNCGNSFHDTEVQGPAATPLCPSCRPGEKRLSTRNIVFRKWLPCGRCPPCRLTEDCGACASCRRGVLHPGSQKAVRCRRRKCLCPIRKKKAKPTSKTLRRQKTRSSGGHWPYDDSKQPKKLSGSLYSDPEDFPMDFDNDDIESLPASPRGQSKRRNRRACWRCDACLRTTDCGKCDFCMDKPKFGGHNKKRQKCRLRQCQSHAMPHLLPFQMGQSKTMTSVGWMGRGKRRSPRTRSTNHRRVHKLRASWEDLDITGDEDDEEGYIGTLRPGVYQIENNGALADEEEDAGSVRAAQMERVVSAMNFDHSPDKLNRGGFYDSDVSLTAQGSEVVYTCPEEPLGYGSLPALLANAANGDLRLGVGDELRIVQVDMADGDEHVQEVTPVITEIFSLAEGALLHSGAEQGLLQLLESLRRTVLPAHWVGVMARGPRLQMLQCSRLSTMADTALHIEPGFSYQISVQDQPLLLTHRLYEGRPVRLDAVRDVVALLVDLEAYTVCQGYAVCAVRSNREPVPHVRAAACELLVPQSEERCEKCTESSP